MGSVYAWAYAQDNAVKVRQGVGADGCLVLAEELVKNAICPQLALQVRAEEKEEEEEISGIIK